MSREKGKRTFVQGILTRSPIPLREITRNPGSRVGLAMISFIMLTSILAGFLSPYNPIRQNIGIAFQPPGLAHLFGTDQLGRDVLSRVLYGGRDSIVIAILALSVAVLLGATVGLLSGYFRRLGIYLMRIADIFLAFPSIILAIVISVALGPGFTSLIYAMSVAMWPGYARLVEGLTISTKEREYVSGAKAIGEKNASIMLRYILPNFLYLIIVAVAIDLSAVILIASGLSFLGLGVQPPASEWGLMISEARPYMATAPWIAFFPGAFLFILALGLLIFGEALRDILDPRHRGL